MSAPKPQARTSYPRDRAAIAAGYRHIADLIESGDAPIPMSCHLSFSVRDGEYGTTAGAPAAEFAASLRRALGGGRWEKDTEANPDYLVLRGMCGGLPINVWMNRDQVCERVVIGTETVTVPARAAIYLPPIEEERTEVREIVEWRCSPLLSADEPAETAEATS